MSGNVFVSPYNPVQGMGVRAKNPPDLVIAGRAPVSGAGKDFGFFPGTLWLYVGTGFYGLVSVTFDPTTGVSTSSWETLGAGGSGVSSITGTANEITASASTGAVTLSVPSTFIAPGSIASTSTITAATGLTVTAGGATVTAGGLTVTAGTTALVALTQVGTANINATGAATTNIGTSTGAVNLGNTTAASILTAQRSIGTAITGTGVLTSASANQYMNITGAGGYTITLPNGLPVGTEMDFFNSSSGTITFAASGTIHGAGSLQLATQYTGASAKQISAGVWQIVGALT